MAIIDALAKRFLNKAKIIRKNTLNANAIQVTLQSPDFNSNTYVPGKFLRIFCGMDKEVALNDKIRSYSIWKYDADSNTADLAICTHSEGPGSTWAKELEVGSDIYFNWHKSNLTIDDSADYYILVGDLSALGHLYELNRNLRGNKIIHSLIYSRYEKDFFNDIKGNAPLQFYTLTENPGQAIIERLNNIVTKSKGKGILYAVGDSRICIALNQHFRLELKWSINQIKTKPFWNPVKKGLE